MSNPMPEVDLENINIVQLRAAEAATEHGAVTAVITTNRGIMKALLYPEYAPETVRNFTELASSGYYDGTFIYGIERGVYFCAGSPNDDGSLRDDYSREREQVPLELHSNLWPFTGALCALTMPVGNNAVIDYLTGKNESCVGSRFLIPNTVELDEETRTEMRDLHAELASAFETLGGIPEMSQKLGIFGQVYEGLELVSEIAGADNSIEVIKIESIRIVHTLKWDNN